MNIEPVNLISEIGSDIQAIEDDAEIYDEVHFTHRADTIDFIDFHIIDRIAGLLSTQPNAELETLKQRAEKAKQRLENIDTTLFKRLREQIALGDYSTVAFKAMIHNYLGSSISPMAGKEGYDNFDNFINGLLSDQPLPEMSKALKPEMVFYQQTPARIIFELAERGQITQDDVFFDIGSGLGHVSIMVNLLTGAKTSGIEYEPAFCKYASANALKLNLPDVTFINTIAQNADYTNGNVFFMYTPFGGQMLQEMLDLLKKESFNRVIRIFTYGPCSPYVASESWLNCVNGPADDIYKLYEFKSVTA